MRPMLAADLTRASYLMVCSVALITAPDPATACIILDRAETLASVVALAARFWLVSLFLWSFILCFDIYERRLSLVLPLGGWVLFLWGVIVLRQVRAGTTGYRTDCTLPLLEYAQYVLGLISVLFGYRAYRAARSN
jgi:hypothetical protein